MRILLQVVVGAVVTLSKNEDSWTILKQKTNQTLIKTVLHTITIWLVINTFISGFSIFKQKSI